MTALQSARSPSPPPSGCSVRASWVWWACREEGKRHRPLGPVSWAAYGPPFCLSWGDPMAVVGVPSSQEARLAMGDTVSTSRKRPVLGSANRSCSSLGPLRGSVPHLRRGLALLGYRFEGTSLWWPGPLNNPGARSSAAASLTAWSSISDGQLHPSRLLFKRPITGPPWRRLLGALNNDSLSACFSGSPVAVLPDPWVGVSRAFIVYFKSGPRGKTC